MSNSFDVLITETTIVDGSGKPAFKGSVGIKGKKIAAIGDIPPENAGKIIDGSKLVTCPGFVDPHSHADQTIQQFPLAANLVMQGITTVVGGNCGISRAPFVENENDPWVEIFGSSFPRDEGLDWRSFDEWLSKLETKGASINYAPLIGHSTVRRKVLGADFKRASTTKEIQEMKKFVQTAMKNGAFGMSAGLDPTYSAHFSAIEELVELAGIVQEYDGFYSPHTRHHTSNWCVEDSSDYGYGIAHSPKGEIITGRYHGLLEAVEICRQANNCRLHIAHMTPAYLIPQPHPDYLGEAVARATLETIVDRPRDQGLDVTFDAIAWAQSLGYETLILDSFFSHRLKLPNWLRAMKKTEFLENLQTGEFRDGVRRVIHSGYFKFGMILPATDPYWMDCFRILKCGNREYQGRTVGELARARKPGRIVEAVYRESVEVIFDALVQDPKTTWAMVMDKRESGPTLPVFFRHPSGMPSTDVIALPASLPEDDQSSMWSSIDVEPIAYGLYPHYFKHFVRELGVLTLEEAVKKATFVPAHDVLKLDDRGVIREGAFADVVIFDLNTISEGNSFHQPTLPPKGIEYVLVNGTVVYQNNSHTGAMPGHVLRFS